MLYDTDIDLAPLQSREVAVIGYGSQGRAQALNLRDSGIAVTVGLRPDSPSRPRAQADGVAVADVAEAVQGADVVAVLLPDEAQPAVYETLIAPHLRRNAMLVFAHGFNIHYRRLAPRADLDVTLVAPFGIGEKVRALFTAGRGTAGMVAIHRDASGSARAAALAYAKALGLGRAGVIETSFAEETETDLFAEQAVLCGGLNHLILAAYETLTEAGYAPEIAYFSCLHEVRLMADMIQSRGIAGTRQAISTTAAYGDLTRGPRVVNGESRRQMAQMLAEIRDGRFAAELNSEAEAGFPALRRGSAHSIEDVGARLRRAMVGDCDDD